MFQNFKFKTWLGKKEFVIGVTTSENIYITINKKRLKKIKSTSKLQRTSDSTNKKGDEMEH